MSILLSLIKGIDMFAVNERDAVRGTHSEVVG
jgi:hypothetical protein